MRGLHSDATATASLARAVLVLRFLVCSELADLRSKGPSQSWSTGQRSEAMGRIAKLLASESWTAIAWKVFIASAASQSQCVTLVGCNCGGNAGREGEAIAQGAGPISCSERWCSTRLDFFSLHQVAKSCLVAFAGCPCGGDAGREGGAIAQGAGRVSSRERWCPTRQDFFSLYQVTKSWLVAFAGCPCGGDAGREGGAIAQGAGRVSC